MVKDGKGVFNEKYRPGVYFSWNAPNQKYTYLKAHYISHEFFFNFLIEFRRKRKNGRSLSVDFTIVPKQIWSIRLRNISTDDDTKSNTTQSKSYGLATIQINTDTNKMLTGFVGQ